MKLRKIIFKLGTADDFDPDMDEQQRIEEAQRTKDREGAFHCWVPAVVYSPELGKNIPGILGLVEEIESGKMYEIMPNLITFCVPCEFWEPKD